MTRWSNVTWFNTFCSVFRPHFTYTRAFRYTYIILLCMLIKTLCYWAHGELSTLFSNAPANRLYILRNYGIPRLLSPICSSHSPQRPDLSRTLHTAATQNTLGQLSFLLGNYVKVYDVHVYARQHTTRENELFLQRVITKPRNGCRVRT